MHSRDASATGMNATHCDALDVAMGLPAPHFLGAKAHHGMFVQMKRMTFISKLKRNCWAALAKIMCGARPPQEVV